MNPLDPLLKPLRYIRVVGPSKGLYDWVVPAILAVPGVAFLDLTNAAIASGADSYLAHTRSLLSVLIGLYLGGLGVFVALTRGDLDRAAEGVTFKYRNAVLTRRETVSYAFAYLAVTALVLFMFSMFVGLGAPAFRGLCDDQRRVLRLVVTSIVTFGLAQMFVITLFSLFYMVSYFEVPKPKP